MRSGAIAFSLSVLLTTNGFAADKRYDVGASDTEIKIGQTMPYSGAASGYGVNGKAELAY